MNAKDQNETKAPGFDIDGYNAVVARAELVFIRLKNLDFKVDDAFALHDDSKDKRSFDGKMEKFVYIKEQGLALGTFKWQVKVRREKKNVIKSAATYEVLYKGVTDLEESNVKRYVQRIGRIGIYPYFRALMAHLDVEAGSRLPPLPVLRA